MRELREGNRGSYNASTSVRSHPAKFGFAVWALAGALFAGTVSRYGAPHPPPRDGSSPSGDSLQSAVALLSRSLRADGTYAGLGEGEHTGHQWRLLQEWARAEGLILPEGFGPEWEGGREHDVRFDQALGRWLKFTKPDTAGYAVELVSGCVRMLPATPLQYLRRWQTGNKLFGDDVALVGLYHEAGAGAWQGWRLVISQEDVAGEPPSWEELDRSMVDDYGLRRLPGEQSPGAYLARAYFAGRNGVFDVRPANCVRTPAGAVVPIDVIPQYFARADAAELARLAA